jgi:hypothetical protein
MRRRKSAHRAFGEPNVAMKPVGGEDRPHATDQMAGAGCSLREISPTGVSIRGIESFANSGGEFFE